jgi:hypothetical protein
MRKRFITAVFLVVAFLTASSQAPAQACGMSMPAPAQQCACCATMKSCLLSQKNPPESTAAAELSQQSLVMIAPILRPLLAPPFAVSLHGARVSAAKLAVHSPPRLALFCTFLI